MANAVQEVVPDIVMAELEYCMVVVVDYRKEVELAMQLEACMFASVYIWHMPAPPCDAYGCLPVLSFWRQPSPVDLLVGGFALAIALCLLYSQTSC